MARKTKLYCAFGANTNIMKMKLRCHYAKIIGTGILENYKLTFRGNHKGVANIERCKNSSVPIVLWEITETCESLLDIFESFPTLYIKEQVEVLVDGKKVQAMAYVMVSDYTNMPALPNEHYFSTIKNGYIDNNLDLEKLQTAYSECLAELKHKV